MRFRGPNGSGVAGGSRPPVEFGPERNVRWVTAVPPGVSSPVVTRDLIFLTAAEAGQLITIAVERASGKIRWRRSVERKREEQKHSLNSSASSTPASDGENAYIFFGEFGLVSYAPDGSERWRKPMGPFANLHGMASSPMLAGTKLIMLCDQDVGSFLLAVDKDSGETVWRTSRPEAVHGFATPALFEPRGDAPQLIVPGSYRLAAYAADDGKELWSAGGLTWQIKTSPVVDGEVVYATGWAPGADAGERRFFPPFAEVAAKADRDRDGKLSPDEIPEPMRHTGSWRAIDLDGDGAMDEREWTFYRARWSSKNVTMAVRPNAGRGDLTHSRVLWQYEKAVPQVSSPLLHQSRLYTVKDGGILTVLDSRTGNVIHQGRLPNAIDAYYSSPVAADGKLYFLSEKGKASVVAIAEGYPTLAVNDMREACYASPAVVDGTLYIRTEQALYAFERPAQ
ncbi:MAG: PQQ-binding-like beta-propeller repeat protein [Bryobacteraceae bacterium]|nr:PQQ-binding-like beta-propeller repeat protein [Bryobacteraceae bacterium]